MTAEQIVRALAAASPLTDYGGGLRCAMCRASIDTSDTGAVLLASHEPDCPWRLAVEWVKGQDVDTVAVLLPDGRRCPLCDEQLVTIEMTRPLDRDAAAAGLTMVSDAVYTVRCAAGHQHAIADVTRTNGGHIASFRLVAADDPPPPPGGTIEG